MKTFGDRLNKLFNEKLEKVSVRIGGVEKRSELADRLESLEHSITISNSACQLEVDSFKTKTETLERGTERLTK